MTSGTMTTLARPYVKAAFEYALAKHDLSAWEKMLDVAATVATDSSAVKLLANPSVTKTQLADLFCDILKPLLSPERENFIRLLADNKRLSTLPDIAALFKAERAAQDKTVTIQVSSAVELNESYQNKLSMALSKKLQRQVELQTHIEPELLGGILIRIGDTVIDGSVRGRLNRLIEFI